MSAVTAQAAHAVPAPSGGRAVPYHCPFCGEQDLHPHDAAPGAWHCRTCLRAFTVRFLGLAEVAPWLPGRTGTPAGRTGTTTGTATDPEPGATPGPPPSTTTGTTTGTTPTGPTRGGTR